MSDASSKKRDLYLTGVRNLHAAENQAVDRTHRIGQTQKVMVYRMVAQGTIEEKVLGKKNFLWKFISDYAQIVKPM